jgi:SAM-dependent methyltransferase
MSQHVCPWWLGYLLASPMRRLIHDPSRILAAHVQPGMTVLEPGPGMGFFTLELARRVGTTGRVLAVDLEPRMLASLMRRAERAKLANRIETRIVQPESMELADLQGQVDLVLAFAVVHEMPSPSEFFIEAALAMKAGATMLLAEPTGHVLLADFDHELADAAKAGLVLSGRPAVRRCHTALLKKEK